MSLPTWTLSKADVVGGRALEGGSVVADVRDTGGGSELLDRQAGGSVKRVHKQDRGAGGDVGLGDRHSVVVVPEAFWILNWELV